VAGHDAILLGRNIQPHFFGIKALLNMPIRISINMGAGLANGSIIVAKEPVLQAVVVCATWCNYHIFANLRTFLQSRF
jgi:hypothetical protein